MPARASASGLIQFRSIVNGQSQLTLTLQAPNGQELSRTPARQVTVQAGLDTVVAVLLLTALGLLLALGVYRNVKRRGRASRTAAD